MGCDQAFLKMGQEEFEVTVNGQVIAEPQPLPDPAACS